MNKQYQIQKVITECHEKMNMTFGKEVAPGMYEFNSGGIVLLTGRAGKEQIGKALEDHIKQFMKDERISNP